MSQSRYDASGSTKTLLAEQASYIKAQEKTMQVVNQIGGSWRYYAAKGTTLYLANGAALYSSTDNSTTQTLLYTFPTTILAIKILISGSLLAVIGTVDSSSFYRSADGGTTWTQVFIMPYTYLDHGITQTSDGSIYYGTYATVVDVGDIYRSDDDGVTWNKVNTITGIRHIHCIREDTYNPGTIYISCGDTTPQSRMIKSTDKCQTLQIIGQNSQVWRAVSILFSEKYLIWGMDSTTSMEDADLVRMDRTTGEIDHLFTLNAPAYYAYKTSSGVLMIATTPEEAVTTTEVASKIYYSPDDGETWGVLYSYTFPSTGSRIIYFNGETNDGVIYISQRVDEGIRQNFAFKIVDTAMLNLPIQPLTPLKFYYDVDANDKFINNVASIYGSSASTMHISGINNKSVYLGYGAAHGKTYLSYRGVNKVVVDGLGMQWQTNGDGPIILSPNGTRYKISVSDAGTITVAPI